MGSEADALGKRTADFVVHGTVPQTFETPRDRLGTSLVTETAAVFVRNILPAPSHDDLKLDDRDAWALEVRGVRRPGVVTLGELKRLGRTQVTTVLQCSGNGRAFFEHGPPGVPWGPGAVANTTWAGVPVATLVEARGGLAGSGVRFLTATGGEPLPVGADERRTVVERSIPAEKALRDCLLAWELGGEPIPRAHGAPLRLVVPGYYGINQVKYVKRLSFGEHESDTRYQALEYRARPLGADPAPEHPPMWEMAVKSLVTQPAGTTGVPRGPLTVCGVAFAGETPVERVEVSTDGGTTWHDARLVGEVLGPTAWRLWEHDVEAVAGRLTIASRAHDRGGRSQPEHPPADAAGYGHNGWRAHAVTVEVRP